MMWTMDAGVSLITLKNEHGLAFWGAPCINGVYSLYLRLIVSRRIIEGLPRRLTLDVISRKWPPQNGKGKKEESSHLNRLSSLS